MYASHGRARGSTGEGSCRVEKWSGEEVRDGWRGVPLYFQNKNARGGEWSYHYIVADSERERRATEKCLLYSDIDCSASHRFLRSRTRIKSQEGCYILLCPVNNLEWFRLPSRLSWIVRRLYLKKPYFSIWKPANLLAGRVRTEKVSRFPSSCAFIPLDTRILWWEFTWKTQHSRSDQVRLWSLIRWKPNVTLRLLVSWQVVHFPTDPPSFSHQ